MLCILSFTYWLRALDKIFVTASFITNIKEFQGWYPLWHHSSSNKKYEYWEIDEYRSAWSLSRQRIPNAESSSLSSFSPFLEVNKNFHQNHRNWETGWCYGIVGIIVKWLGKKSDKVANIKRNCWNDEPRTQYTLYTHDNTTKSCILFVLKSGWLLAL